MFFTLWKNYEPSRDCLHSSYSYLAIITSTGNTKRGTIDVSVLAIRRRLVVGWIYWCQVILKFQKSLFFRRYSVVNIIFSCPMSLTHLKLLFCIYSDTICLISSTHKSKLQFPTVCIIFLAIIHLYLLSNIIFSLIFYSSEYLWISHTKLFLC